MPLARQEINPRTLITQARHRIEARLPPLSPRGALALKLLVLTLLLAVYLEAAERADAAAARADAAQARVQGLAALQDEAAWLQQAERIAALEQDWTGGRWRAATAGVGAAAVRQTLQQITAGRNRVRARVQVSADPLIVDGEQVLSYSVTANGRKPALVAVLADMALHQPRLVTTEVALRIASQPASFTVSGIAPFALDAAPAAGE